MFDLVVRQTIYNITFLTQNALTYIPPGLKTARGDIILHVYFFNRRFVRILL
jgi:hypothetical protein